MNKRNKEDEVNKRRMNRDEYEKGENMKREKATRARKDR